MFRASIKPLSPNINYIPIVVRYNILEMSNTRGVGGFPARGSGLGGPVYQRSGLEV